MRRPVDRPASEAAEKSAVQLVRAFRRLCRDLVSICRSGKKHTETSPEWGERA